MKIHILGCGDAFGSGGRQQSSYLVEASDRLFLLDCGATALIAMKRAGFDPLRLDAIFLSHLHGDHFAGLPFFFIEYLHRRPRSRPLDVAGPAGTKDRACDLFRLMYGSGEMEDLPMMEFHVLEPERPTQIAGVDVFAFRVPHQVSDVSLALKTTYEKKQILFSGDSGWTERFVSEARDVDLFLCECSFYDQGAGNHVRYLTLQEHVARLGCRRLVLTHLGEEMLARRHELPSVFAEDGMLIEI